MSFLHVTGRLGSDAELRNLQDGTPVASFSIADEIRAKGEKKVQWIRCALFGKRAESLAQYLTKGSVVEVVGNPSINTYEGKSGTKYELQVRVIEVNLHGGGKADRPVADNARATSTDDMNDEIPW
jgi:single-strand DNA-binding protein